MIDLWRNNSVKITYSKKYKKIQQKLVFPSARSAITHSLRLSKLSRNSRIAVPEWSSACLLNSISKIATPIPFNEVIKYKINVDGLVIYQQWGWETLSNHIDKLSSIFKNKILILDSVDCTNFIQTHKNYTKYGKFFSQFYNVTSLSKTLGTKYGGLLINKNKFIEFPNDFNSNINPEKIKIKDEDIKVDFLKSQTSLLPKELKKWLKNYDINTSLEIENFQRLKNFELLVVSNLTKKWPKWMKEYDTNNLSSPGIVPLFFGYENKKIILIQNILLKKFNIKTSIYHFNKSGDQVNSNYKKCLAFPIHGQIKNLKKIINILEQY